MPTIKSSTTPGPWGHDELTQTIIGFDGQPIAAPVDGYDEDQWAADAPLLAAAWDMLDVLRTTAGNIRHLHSATHGELFEAYAIWLQIVEQAIAKAEGRS